MELSSLEIGIINDILINNNNLQKNKFDVNKIRYNSYYHSPEFWFKKFPKGFENIPQMELIINEIIEKNHDNSPLAEIESLNDKSRENYYEQCKEISNLNLNE